MGAVKVACVDEIVKRGSVKDGDVQRLRADLFSDGLIREDEVLLLFRINEGCPVQDASWPVFFVEAVTDYVVREAEPEGYVTSENARWLISRISADGHIDTKTELELLVSILERARWTPASLVAFALDQVRRAVVEGSGPLRSGQCLKKGEIGEAEVELLRRILYAFGGDGNVAITRAEAEILLDIEEALQGTEPNPAWTELFSKAIANSIMGASGYGVPSREEALGREMSPEQGGELSPAKGLVSVVAQGLAGLKDLYREQSAEERALARLERQRIEIITNEEITEGEVEWLASRVGRGGRVTANQRALIDFIGKQGVKLHPAFTLLAAKAAEAA